MGNQISVSPNKDYTSTNRNDNNRQNQVTTKWLASAYGTTTNVAPSSSDDTVQSQLAASPQSLRRYPSRNKRSPQILTIPAEPKKTRRKRSWKSLSNRVLKKGRTNNTIGRQATAVAYTGWKSASYGITFLNSVTIDASSFEFYPYNTIKNHSKTLPVDLLLVPEAHDKVDHEITIDPCSTIKRTSKGKSCSKDMSLSSEVMNGNIQNLGEHKRTVHREEPEIIRTILVNQTLNKRLIQSRHKTQRLFMKSFFNKRSTEVTTGVYTNNYSDYENTKENPKTPITVRSSNIENLDQSLVVPCDVFNQKRDLNTVISSTVSKELYKKEKIKDDQKIMIDSINKENCHTNKLKDEIFIPEDSEKKIKKMVFQVRTETAMKMVVKPEPQDDYSIESCSDEDDDYDPDEPHNLESNPRSKRQRRSSFDGSSCTKVQKDYVVPQILNNDATIDSFSIHSAGVESVDNSPHKSTNGIHFNGIDEPNTIHASNEGENNDYDTRISSCYSFNEFMQIRNVIEEEWRCTLSRIDSSKHFREGNSKLHPWESTTQLYATYGRVECPTLHQIFRHALDLQTTDRFVDIGHGIGIANLQAAYTFGCESRGIELVRSRYDASSLLQRTMERIHQENNELHNRNATIGPVNLIQGRLEDPKNRDFLISPSPSYGNINGIFRSTTKVFVNNFDETFGERSSKKRSLVHLDAYVAGLFALMVPGSIMVTLYPLPLPPPREEVEKNREKHNLPVGSKNSSFYDVEKIPLGKKRGQVTWAKQRGDEELYIWKYTRLEQDEDPDFPVFLCSNPECCSNITTNHTNGGSSSSNSIPSPAIQTIKNSLGEEGIIIETSCHNCCMIQKSLRQSNRVFYGDM